MLSLDSYENMLYLGYCEYFVIYGKVKWNVWEIKD